MTERDQSAEEPFWHLDEELVELELKERPSGPEPYSVRLKARTESTPYYPKRELYPLSHSGRKHEVSGKAYILVLDITLTVGVHPQEQPSGAIGEVTASEWQGMRHHDIANVRGLYFDADQALAIGEVDEWQRLDDFAHGKLWQFFEGWLVQRFPAATRIFTDDAEPHEDTERNRGFLRNLGYQHVAGTHRIFAKEVARP
ncbi:MAG TPA: hypothetical protein VKX16_06675 [Chloroflexota bacterium]|nr:hypothetical protein [Chloroflexota bacterium]